MESTCEKTIIAITGSIGKKVTKMLIAVILKQRSIIFELKEYYNIYQNNTQHVNEIGLIHRDTVLEYGMGDDGDITGHYQMIQPNISIMTTVYEKRIPVIHVGTIILGQGKSNLNTCNIVSFLCDQSKKN